MAEVLVKLFGAGGCLICLLGHLMISLLAPGSAAASEAVQILLTRPGQLAVPLHARSGSDSVLTLGGLVELLQQAGQDVKIIEQVPFVRALMTARTSTTPVCIPLLLRNPEREEYLAYSSPIRQEEPLIVLHHRDDTSFGGYRSFDELMKDSRQILGWRQGTTLGSDMERRLASYQPPLAIVSTPGTRVCDMVVGGRASYCLVTDRMLSEVPENVTKQPELLRALRLDGAPRLEAEAIGCNRATPADFIAQINRLLVD